MLVTLPKIKDLEGFSFCLSGDEFPNESGYMIALKGSEEKHPADSQFLQAYLLTFIGKHAHNLAYGRVAVGGWKHENEYFFDVSIWMRYKENSLAFAKMNNQLAVYDLENKCSIYL